MQKPRTADQILSDLNKQFPKPTVEEGKQTMARKTKPAAPETVQEDPSRVRRLLQKHQNKKLTPDDMGRLMTEAFGQQVQYQLSKAITAITDKHLVRVQPNHITFDFRGGWGKAVNIRAFIPQAHDGRGVMVRISMDVVNGVWDAKTAKQYEDPHPYEGSPIEDTSAAGAGNAREDAKLPADDTNSKKIQQSSISGARLPAASARVLCIDAIETERSGVVYHSVIVDTGYLKVGDTGNIVDHNGAVLCPAEIKNMVDDMGIVENLGCGNTAAVQLEYVADGGAHVVPGYSFVIPVRHRGQVATKDEAVAGTFADLGRRAVRPLHSRNPTPPTRDGYAVVTGAHPSPKGTQHGVQVRDGNLRISDVLQVWREGRFLTGATITGISRAKGEEIGIVLMGEEAGVYLSFPGVIDLKAGDELYVVQRMSVEMVLDNAIFDEDARGRFAAIPFEIQNPKLMIEKARSALVVLCMPVNEIANALSAVTLLVEAVRQSTVSDKAKNLVIEYLHADELYPRAMRATVQFGEVRDSSGMGTLFIADGMARTNTLYGVGSMIYNAPILDKPMHGLLAYCTLSSYLDSLDERDRADFEHSWLETHKLGLAESVVFRQSQNQVMEVWLEKHKTMPSGRLVATLEFGSNGIERFHFHEVEDVEKLTRIETGVKVGIREGGFVIEGPLRANFAPALAKLSNTLFASMMVQVVDGFKEVQRVATEALVDNPDHWKDDEIVPWEAEFRGLRNGAVLEAVVLIRNMKDGYPTSGFCLKIASTRGYVRTSLVYGFGRYADLKLVKGIEMWAAQGIPLIADHLIDAKTDYRDVSFIGAFAEGVTQPDDKIILLEQAEHNGYVIVLTERMGQKVANTPQAVLGTLNLVNGRVVSWTTAGKRRAEKQQPQPHRHHHMDAEHATTSIVPRPQPTGSFTNLAPYQAQSVLRILVEEEGDAPKLALLNNFIEQVCTDAQSGGTGNALLFSVGLHDKRLHVGVNYIETNGEHKAVADMAVYL